jgi:hypothetical protein
MPQVKPFIKPKSDVTTPTTSTIVPPVDKRHRHKWEQHGSGMICESCGLVKDAPLPKLTVENQDAGLPSRNDVADLCNLAARVYHTDAPFIKKVKGRKVTVPANHGQVYTLVTRVRAKLGGLP